MADPNPALASVGSALIVSDAPSIGRNTGTGIRAKRTNAAKQLAGPVVPTQAGVGPFRFRMFDPDSRG
jgi:hypothetical protein